MPSKSSTRIAEPLLGGPVGIHLGAAGRRFRSSQAYVLAAILGVTTFLALALQGPCLSSGYEQPSASARMCAGSLSTAFSGDVNPEVLGRSHGGAAALAPLEARLVDLFHLFTDDVSVFMVGVLLLNTAGIAALGVGLLALARFRGWLVAVFASPLILFTLGSTLDPFAVALSIWAMALFIGPPPLRPRGWLTGVLLGIATFINPLALLVLLALTLAGPNPARGLKPRNPRMMLAAAMITSAVLLVVDLTAIDRIIHWYSDAIDGGSFASILLMAEVGDTSVWAPVWIIASAGVVLAVAVSLYLGRRTGLDPAVSACLLIGGCLLLAPGLMPWDSLWLLPFVALSIRRWWVLIVWTLAEAVFAIAIQLGDVSGFEKDEGLDPTWVALFTLLRLLALVLVVIMAGENLYRRGIRGGTVTAGPPRRGDGSAPTETAVIGPKESLDLGRKEEHETGHDSLRTRRLD
ncbi:hypothetical protein BI49514_02114 [Brevibacterium iodinum ATCC 49514]|uniref:Alpha-1,2-mannosyltransferase n=1 Tax=Brevibacterium iodinum ATCC 49514 TaxID=1255616 RepID=A0A2H1JKV2_9MICO|nr:hypothetical protein [Brevibacterium iodinum]SMX88165.1 hypothetical protein BI49514_02114 [Brevibacterium iodinum ATCC 49514]SUW14078.1 Predicted integral membrane protein [Brevibacterium iodinum]